MKALDSFKRLFDQTPKPTARVVGRDLVVSLPNAIKPCVWKTDLEEIKSALFEVDLENAAYQLVMKDGQGKKEVINTYEEKEDAVDALNIISKALLYSNSKRVNEAYDNEDKPLGFFKSFIIFLAFFFIIMFIAGLFVPDSKGGDVVTSTSSQEVQLEKIEENTPEKTKQQKDNSMKDKPEGVPLSADDLLGGGQ